jgi:cyanophycinase
MERGVPLRSNPRYRRIGQPTPAASMTFSHSATARRFAVALFLIAAGCVPAARGIAYIPTPAAGPVEGTLVIAGGGELRGTGIIERFIELAGGPSEPIVVIPTADGDSNYTPRWAGLSPFVAAGARNIHILHTYDPEEADTEAFVQPLREAKAVWFMGGRQWRLADAYLGTRTEEELNALLARGGVIGGSSAGASIQASFLVRGAREGNHIVMSPDYERGFGFLHNAAIDQHLIVRNRERDLLQVLSAHPYLLGIGIDESTAIVVRGNSFEVIGSSQVAVYDGTRRTGRRGYYFLTAGDRYDMEARALLRALADD